MPAAGPPPGTPYLDAEVFSSFAPLLRACDSFARLTGGRYTKAMFSDLRGDDSEADRARLEAMPAVSEFAERLASGAAGCPEELLRDFKAAEKLVLREAVFCSMVSTCRSVELWPAKAGLSSSDTAYQDTSEPLERIAQRLYNFTELRRSHGEEQAHTRLMLAASFVLEFGCAHGLPPTQSDPVAEDMLMGFLARVKEWGERHKKQELRPSLDQLPTSLRGKAESWWKANWKGVAVGAGLLAAGGLLLGAGMLLASSAAASSGSGSRGGGTGRSSSRGRGR